MNTIETVAAVVFALTVVAFVFALATARARLTAKRDGSQSKTHGLVRAVFILTGIVAMFIVGMAFYVVA